MNRTYTLSELADAVGGTLRGSGSATMVGVDDVSQAGPDRATWVSRPEYESRLAESSAGVVLVPKDFGPTPMPAILCDNIERSVALLLQAFAEPIPRPEPGIHPSAVVHPSAHVGEGAAIGPHVVVESEARIGESTALHAGVFIGHGTTIGDACVLWPNVVVREGCVVGNRVMLHPNVVIGADGLGFYFDQGRHNKVPHTGGVIIGDDVEMGACSCVDRAKFGYTMIGRGTKIDNLVQIGHNCRIGEHCVLVALAGVGGSTRVGDYCIFGGQAGAIDNVSIGRGARLAGGLAVATHDIPEGVTVSGWPAQEHRKELRERAWIRRLPTLAEQVKDLRARLERLEKTTDHRE